jgi:predicted transcriptional regulator
MSIDTNSLNDLTVDQIVAGLSPMKRAVYDAFVEHGPMTDDELVENSRIKKATSSPRRSDLVKLGLVESVGKVDTPGGSKATRWALVPPERIAEARAQATEKGPRRRPISSYPLDIRLELTRQLLDMNDVNDAIAERAHGRAWSRVRGRKNDRRGERNRELRENDALLKEAQERGSPKAEYYKLRRILIQSNERVLAVSRLVADELERGSTFEQAIPIGAWPDVADLLNDLARVCDDTNAQIRKVMGDLGDDVIDGSVVEIDDFILPEGDGEADVA